MALDFLDTIKKGVALPRTQPQTASSLEAFRIFSFQLAGTADVITICPDAVDYTGIGLVIVSGGLFDGIDLAVSTGLAQKARGPALLAPAGRKPSFPPTHPYAPSPTRKTYRAAFCGLPVQPPCRE